MEEISIDPYLKNEMQLAQSNTRTYYITMNKGMSASIASLPALLFSLGISTIIFLSGCANSKPPVIVRTAVDQPRVIRISFVGQHGSFRMRINQQPVQKLGNTEFATSMIQLNLTYGDIVVWGDQRDEKGRELSQPDEISRWWFKYLKNARASYYSMPHKKDFFSTPIFHWLAPFEKPRPITGATFFVNGRSFGRGSDGFHKMMDEIDAMKIGPVLIFAPRIKNEGQSSPRIAEDQLLAWAKDAAVETQFEKLLVSRYAGFMDFGRFMDND